MHACTCTHAHARARAHTHTQKRTQHNNEFNNVVTDGGTKASRILISVKFH